MVRCKLITTFIYRVSEGSVSSSDKYGYIPNFESSIDFGIDDKLMEYLETVGVEINPEDELVRFELNCEVTQGDQSYVQIATIDMKVTNHEGILTLCN